MERNQEHLNYRAPFGSDGSGSIRIGWRKWRADEALADVDEADEVPDVFFAVAAVLALLLVLVVGAAVVVGLATVGHW